MSRSDLKQPRSCNLFRALFCCLQPQDGPKLPPLPPSQQALLESHENGTVVKVTLFRFQRAVFAQMSRRLTLCLLLEEEEEELGPTNTILRQRCTCSVHTGAERSLTHTRSVTPKPPRVCAESRHLSTTYTRSAPPVGTSCYQSDSKV